MKYIYRGELNNGKMVDIFKFEGEYAVCDHKMGKIHIDEFNTIYFPRDTFKKQMLKIDVEEIKLEKKSSVKKSK